MENKPLKDKELEIGDVPMDVFRKKDVVEAIQRLKLALCPLEQANCDQLWCMNRNKQIDAIFGEFK